MKKFVCLIIICLCFPVSSYSGTADDIASMQAGTWYSITSSSLSGSGVYNPNSVAGNTNIFAYSGGAFDSTGNRLIVYGGGHADYRGNEIYFFNLDVSGTLYDYKWTIASGEGGQSSKTYLDACYDCTSSCTAGYVLGDGKPMANHTYQTLAYHPTLNALIQTTEGAYSGTGSCYPDKTNSARYNFNYFYFDTNTWEILTSPYSVMGTSSYGVSLVASNGDVWVFQESGDTNDRVLQYDYSAGTWASRNTANGLYGEGLLVGAVDTDNDVAVVLGNGYFSVWQLGESSITLLSSTYTGAAGLVNSDGASLTWDSSTGLFVGWTGLSGYEESVYVLKVDTATSTYHFMEVLPAASNSVSVTTRTTSGAYGPFGRFSYSPTENLFVLADIYTETVKIYKLTESTTDTDFPEVTFSAPSTSASTTIADITVSATDATSAILGYQITLTPVPPKPWTSSWTTAPTSYVVPTAGRWDLYAWAMDAHGNVSRFAVDTVDVLTTDVYVDADCSDGTAYNFSTKACTGGSARVYDTISEAVTYANTNNTTSVAHIIKIDPADTWTGSRDDETSESGACYGLPDDYTNIPLHMAHAGQVTITSMTTTPAKIEWLCRSVDNSSYDWGPGVTDHHSIINNSATGDLRVEYLEITGAPSNGAGIWVEPDAGDLLVKNCSIHDNDNGILTSEDTDVDVTLLYNTIFHNSSYKGTAGQQHNLYIGQGGTLVAMFNYIYDSYRGSLIKSRNNYNWIMYNRLTDENTGECASQTYCTNYNIDLSFGGETYLIGNLLSKGTKAAQATFINYAREVYYTFEFVNGGAGANGVVLDNEQMQDDNGNIFRAAYAHYPGPTAGDCITGDWATGNCYGYMDVRQVWNSTYSAWYAITEAMNPDTWFAEGEVFTYDSGASSVTSGGVPSYSTYTDKWSWANPTNKILYIGNNSVVNEYIGGTEQTFVQAHHDTTTLTVQNNVAVSRGSQPTEFQWDSTASTANNEKAASLDHIYLLEQASGDPGFTAISTYDYSLTSAATNLINQGTAPATVNGYQVIPQWQYAHPASKTTRDLVGTIDIGAYESTGSDTTTPTISGCSFSGVSIGGTP